MTTNFLQSTKMKCCLLSCEGDISLNDERVEVCTGRVTTGNLKKTTMRVKWEKSGDAVFHPGCWDEVLQASQTYNPKKDTFKLSQVEKRMIKEASETAEKHDSLLTVRSKAIAVADLIKKSKFCCVFTGAGISTSAGIGDYRGKKGKWTEMDRAIGTTDKVASDTTDEPSAKKRRTEEQVDDEQDTEEEDGVPYEQFRPTYTHEAIKKLVDLGHIKYVISQNCDGLHGLSGIPAPLLSELHGNVFEEKCESCGHRYKRSYYVSDDNLSQYYEDLELYKTTDIKKPPHAKKCALCGLSHRTGRKCSQKIDKKGKKCKGFLIDTIINFRDNLEEEVLNRATTNAKSCDLMLSLGTTMTVTPASNLVKMGKKPLRLVICNRQETDLDSRCLKRKKDTDNALGVRVFGDCDTLMKEAMKHLLTVKELKDWEDARHVRMEAYDSQREADS